MSTTKNGNSPLFIPEKESPVFIWLFYRYVLSLYRRRFRAVWLDDRQLPRTRRATLYIGNHNTWWDALNPLLLNERVIGKRARAMMDEEQLLRYPFFRRLGVFSINRQHPRKALASLDHAVRLLNESGYGQEPHPPEAGTSPAVDAPADAGSPIAAGTPADAGASRAAGSKANPDADPLSGLPRSKRPVGLWFYPEGKLVRPDTPVVAENGITWLARKLDPARTEIVPFATHIHSMRGDKPELFVRMGPAIDPRMFEMSGEPARDQAQTRRIAGIIEQLRESVRRDSADFGGSGSKNTVDGFRLLLGRSY